MGPNTARNILTPETSGDKSIYLPNVISGQKVPETRCGIEALQAQVSAILYRLHSFDGASPQKAVQATNRRKHPNMERGNETYGLEDYLAFQSIQTLSDGTIVHFEPVVKELPPPVTIMIKEEGQVLHANAFPVSFTEPFKLNNLQENLTNLSSITWDKTTTDEVKYRYVHAQSAFIRDGARVLNTMGLELGLGLLKQIIPGVSLGNLAEMVVLHTLCNSPYIKHIFNGGEVDLKLGIDFLVETVSGDYMAIQVKSISGEGWNVMRNSDNYWRNLSKEIVDEVSTLLPKAYIISERKKYYKICKGKKVKPIIVYTEKTVPLNIGTSEIVKYLKILQNAKPEVRVTNRKEKAILEAIANAIRQIRKKRKNAVGLRLFHSMSTMFGREIHVINSSGNRALAYPLVILCDPNKNNDLLFLIQRLDEKVRKAFPHLRSFFPQPPAEQPPTY